MLDKRDNKFLAPSLYFSLSEVHINVPSPDRILHINLMLCVMDTSQDMKMS